MEIKKLKDKLSEITSDAYIDVHFSKCLHRAPLIINNNITDNYQILNSQNAGLHGLAINLKPKSKNIDWFFEKKFKKEIDKIMCQYLPITMKYEIKYFFYNQKTWVEIQNYILDESIISS